VWVIGLTGAAGQLVTSFPLSTPHPLQLLAVVLAELAKLPRPFLSQSLNVSSSPLFVRFVNSSHILMLGLESELKREFLS
jgi:hypothetical protein